jgi:hypothetical protein
VYADWLDDHGEPERAEFIRVQCALAQAAPDHPNRPRWEARQEELLAAHQHAWIGPLKKLPTGWTFHRGLVEKVTLTAKVFVDRAEELFRRAPLRMVEVWSVDAPLLRRLLALPHLARLQGLVLPGGMRHAGAQVLAQTPSLAGLRALDLRGNPLGVRGMQELADSPYLTQLTHLSLEGTALRDDGVGVLAESPRFATLMVLDLRGNRMTVRGLRALAASPHLKRLTRLGLWYNRLGDRGAAELAASPFLAQLRHLSLGYNGLGPRGIRALAGSPNLSGLTRLHLGVDRYGAEGALALARSPYLNPQAVLSLAYCEDLSRETRNLLKARLGERISFEFIPDRGCDWPLWRA